MASASGTTARSSGKWWRKGLLGMTIVMWFLALQKLLIVLGILSIRTAPWFSITEWVVLIPFAIGVAFGIKAFEPYEIMTMKGPQYLNVPRELTSLRNYFLLFGLMTIVLAFF